MPTELLPTESGDVDQLEGAGQGPSEDQIIGSPAGLSYTLPESICGQDTRTQITNTTEGILNNICYLNMRFGSSWYLGTGWFVTINRGTARNNVILTSGHCVFETGSRKFADEVVVYPAANGNDHPHGSYTVGTSNLRASQGWQQAQGQNYDYGAILLPTSTIGGWWGSIGYAMLSDTQLNGLDVTITGYPGDKPRGTMWTDNGPVTLVQAQQIYYMNDTMGGESGSPTYATVNDVIYSVGIHGYGGCPNHSVRMTSSVVNDFTAWSNEAV